MRADRKGSLGFAIAATLGALFVVVAAGYPSLALVLGLGHVTLRSLQVGDCFRSPPIASDCP